MWNVKRVLIFVSSAFVSLCGFAVYALFLGHINAMPILPTEKLPLSPGEIEVGPIGNTVDQKLVQSFGPNCSEKQWPLRLWIQEKGIAFAAGDFSIEKDGKVKMAPLSVAMYHKSKAPGAFPEISTIRCEVAFITLDKAVSSYSELNNRDIIGVEMTGKDIVLTNNRRTAEKSDDVDIRISSGNLLYEKRKNLIWTEGVVRLLDFQSNPPTEVRGKGLHMHLAPDSKSAGAARSANKLQLAKPANDNGNIEKIHLLAHVDMHFWVDAKAGFLGGEPNAKIAKAPAGPPAPAEKAHIHIKTGGPFIYDLVKETASFESPQIASSGGPIAPDQVSVERRQKIAGKDKVDQLICDRLDLAFRKKNTAADTGALGGGDKEIETAHAVRRDKNEVVVSLDTEQMAAYGSELLYRAGDVKNGPETILKGEPLKTVKEGHKMVCTELYLYSANRAGEGQKAIAKGKGQIDLIDTKNPGKPSWPTHVLWDDVLEVVKVREGERVYDVMTVTGDASFIDDLQKQELHGGVIRVWIEQMSELAKKLDAGNNSRQELRRVEAVDQVRAVSPEFIIRKTNRLNMIFMPQTPAAMRLPNADETGPAVIQKDPSAPIVQEQPKDVKVAEKKPAPPIELSGNNITGTVFTLAGKKELQDLKVEGNVHVFQPGEKQGEKRINITGQLLTVKYVDKGHVMVVHGDEKNLAHVEMGELTLWGPIVTIDKGENRADVAGRGAMKVPSNKNLDGTDVAKGKTGMLVIHWNKTMNFDGRMAIFDGGVQAFQNEYSKLQCESLTAKFDRFVSFKDGQKENHNAKIDKILCDKNVFIDDSKVDERKQLAQRNVLMGTSMSVDNLEGGTFINGPGEVRTLGKGNAALEAAPDPKAAPAKQEWKLTHVKFTQRMFSNTKSATKNAIFYGDNSGVEVFHFATTDINAKMNADKPGKDQLYLRCGILQVEGKQFVDRTTQYMVAKQNVEFRTDKYLGYADVVKYDESTETVIFEGLNGNRVRIFDVSGDRPREESFSTTKVLYNRKTGTFSSDGVKSISN